MLKSGILMLKILEKYLEKNMFKNYKDEGYIKGIKEQNNIMVFIGNGFDISILKKYREDDLVSSYGKFYDFLCYKGFNKKNLLYKKMEEDKKNNKENWSDFECSLGELLQENISVNILEKALKEMQEMFLLFLNEIVTPEVLLKLNNDIEENEWGKKALERFLGDLSWDDYERMSFPKKTTHYHMYNYLFVNFNYTSLFDNYIYLDKYQFEPHPHETVDTNFKFYPNPNGFNIYGMNERTIWSSFIMTDIIHPHGYQNIPRSLLFGIENNEYTSNRELNRFNKSYWAQDNPKYKSYFNDVELFIIYGTSIGETDNWWWENIFDSLLNKNSELIIYFYQDKEIEKDDVKSIFINACKIRNAYTEEDINKVKEKIYIVFYNEEISHKLFALKNDEDA